MTHPTPSPSALRSWDDLRFFVALARAGRLSAAARALGVKVSTVHRRLGALEAAVGTTLFTRLPSGHVLTDHGRALLDHAEAVEAAVLALEQCAATLDTRRVLRLASTDSLVGFLSEAVAAFCASHPEVQVHFSASEQPVNLARREADIAVRFASTPHKELVIRPLCPVAFALYASPAYTARRGPVEPGSLRGHTFISAGPPLSEAPMFQWLAEQLPTSSVVAQGSSVATVQAAARSGLGIAPLPCHVGDGDPNLDRVHPPVAEGTVTPSLAYHTTLRRSPEAQQLIHHIRGAFQAHAEWFSGKN